MTPRLPHEVVELLELAAAHPDGTEPLFEGHLESVAALYQVRPAQVEAVRRCVARRDHQVEASEIITRGRRLGMGRRARPSRPAGRKEKDAARVIDEALAMPDGVEVLTRAPIELAAVLLQAHPFVVEEARLRLSARSASTLGAELTPPSPSAVAFEQDTRASAPRFAGRAS